MEQLSKGGGLDAVVDEVGDKQVVSSQDRASGGGVLAGSVDGLGLVVGKEEFEVESLHILRVRDSRVHVVVDASGIAVVGADAANEVATLRDVDPLDFIVGEEDGNHDCFLLVGLGGIKVFNVGGGALDLSRGDDNIKEDLSLVVKVGG